MKGFKLKNGDLSMTNNEIDIVQNDELTAQTIQSVTSTNKGECIFDKDEGIDFDVIFGSTVIDEQAIKSEIEQAVAQVDDSMTVEDFSVKCDSTTRKATVNFKAKSANGEALEVKNTWG